MKLPIILIALPGTGKTTAIQSICEILPQPPSEILEIDQIIKARLRCKNPLDPVVEKLIAKYPDQALRIRSEAEQNENGLTSAFFLNDLNETLWRTLEADFLLDILESPEADDAAIDIGGKMFFDPRIREFVLKKPLIPIFLYCDHKEILEHLSQNENWKTRSNYRLAGENGWENLAEEHRNDRMNYMITHSRVIIDVTGLNPEQIAREILWGAKAFQLQKERVLENDLYYNTTDERRAERSRRCKN